MKPALRRWTCDEKAGPDRLLDAGTEAAGIGTEKALVVEPQQVVPG
jgi:hypothetical protein